MKNKCGDGVPIDNDAKCFLPGGSIPENVGGTRLSPPRRIPPDVDWYPGYHRFRIAYPPEAPAQGERFRKRSTNTRSLK